LLVPYTLLLFSLTTEKKCLTEVKYDAKVKKKKRIQERRKKVGKKEGRKEGERGRGRGRGRGKESQVGRSRIQIWDQASKSLWCTYEFCEIIVQAHIYMVIIMYEYINNTIEFGALIHIRLMNQTK
jgi:hypothetical protein